jgi:hypothetical protein
LWCGPFQHPQSLALQVQPFARQPQHESGDRDTPVGFLERVPEHRPLDVVHGFCERLVQMDDESGSLRGPGRGDSLGSDDICREEIWSDEHSVVYGGDQPPHFVDELPGFTGATELTDAQDLKTDWDVWVLLVAGGKGPIY